MAHDRLRIYLFGEPRFETGGAVHAFKAPPKTLPLLAYLLLNRRGPVARETLAAALWPDADQREAFSNLRRHLHYLLKALPPLNGNAPWIRAGQKTLAWNLDSPYWLDVETFETEIQERALRARAVRLYSGHLYERCVEDWIDFERERLRTLQLSALAQLAAEARERSSFVEALQYAQLILAADPWREDALRTIVDIRMLLGDRAGALAEYERFAERLRQELQTEPLGETQNLYQRIRGLKDAPAAEQARATGAVTLIGRQNEYATLRDEWQRAVRGEGRSVLLGGEAGIGKSTLVQALADSVTESGGSVLRGAATPHEDAALAAFAPIADALDADLSAPLSSENERLRGFEHFAALLAQRAQSAPVLVIIEDLHWAGSTTFDLLRYLLLRLANAPVLFVATYREFQTPRTHPLRSLRRQLSKTRRCTTMALSALSREEAAALACLCAGKTLTDDLLQRIYERSDGNPLFVVELVRELRNSGPEAVPGSIHEIVRERLGRLGQDARALLQTAAVAGAFPSPELLVEITGFREADVLLALDELIASHFLRQRADGVTFVHDVIRQSVYEGIREDRRRAIHARAGLALRALYEDRFGDVAAAAAWHFENGGVTGAAAAAYGVAAQHAFDMYAVDEAAMYALKAMQLSADPRDRFQGLRILELVAGAQANRALQGQYLQQMRALSPELLEDERAHALLRTVDFAAGESHEAHQAALHELEELVRQMPGYAPALDLRAGEALSRHGDFVQAREPLQRALAAYSDGRDSDALLRCLTALFIVANLGGSQSALDEIREQIRRTRASLAPQADARLNARLMQAQSAALLDRDPVAAHEVAVAMLEHTQDANDLWLESRAHLLVGACAARRMLLGEAQSHLRRSAEIEAIVGRHREIARVRSWQVMVENRCADFESARLLGNDGLEAARACEAWDLIYSILGNLANTAVWAGDLQTARNNLTESLRLGEQRGYDNSSQQSLLGEVEIGLGNLDRGVRLLEQARDAAAPQSRALSVHRVHLPLLLGLAYLARGRENDARICAESIRSEIDAFACYYVHPQMHLWSAAQFLRMLGYRESESFARAARIRLTEIAATIDDERTRTRFQDFVFNRLIAANAETQDPLKAWYLPYAIDEMPVTARSVR